MLPHLSDDERSESWHVVMPSGNDLTGGEGLLTLAETLRTTRLLGRLLRTLRTTPLLGLLDRFLKRARGRLGRIVPDRPPIRRYP